GQGWGREGGAPPSGSSPSPTAASASRSSREVEMPAPRRRLVRPPPAAPRPERQARVQKLHQRLEKERATLARWMARLRRAFHVVEKQLQRITRIERQLSKQEGP